jgi:type IV secretion system protein VirB9
MNRTSRLGLAGAVCLAAAGLTFSVNAQVMQQYEFQPDRIYPVRTGLGITTQIELSPNEKILDYSTGFSGGWDLTRRENVFYLKPKNVDVDTNMMIRTETHSYIFELKVVATDWKTLEQAKRSVQNYLYLPRGRQFCGRDQQKSGRFRA